MELTKIKIGDNVTFVEMWYHPTTGKLGPDQITFDCRFDGICKEIDEENGRIYAVCDEEDDAIGGWFPIYKEGEWYNKGDSVAMTTEDANKYFPVLGK